MQILPVLTHTPHLSKIEPILREHETLCLYEGGETPIEIINLHDKTAWDEFFVGKTDTEYRQKFSDQWAGRWSDTTMAMSMLSRPGRLMEGYFKRKAKALTKTLKVAGFSLGNAVKFYGDMTWPIEGAHTLDILPFGPNIYEPIIRLYEMGVIVRRSEIDGKSRWLVGYISNP